MNSTRQGSPPLPAPRRGGAWLVALDPTQGSEIQKTRPCVVVSTDALAKLPVRVVVPLTGWQAHHSQYLYKVHVPRDAGNNLDKDSGADPLQVRCVALERFRSRIGVIDRSQLADIASALALVIEAP